MLNTFSDQSALENLTEFCEIFLGEVGTVYAGEMRDLIRSGEFSTVVKSSILPSDYRTQSSFLLDYQVASLLSKMEGLPTGIDTEAAALESFKAFESRCASTNVRFTYARPFSGLDERYLSVSRSIIKGILGAKPRLDRIVSLMRWGPGATSTIKGDRVRPECKMLEPKLSTTPKAMRFARRVVGNDLHWCKARLDDPDRNISVEGPVSLLNSEFNISLSMRVVVVPKNSKTGRTIGAENTLNTYLQSGFGREIRNLLAREGVNLNSQTWNQTLARSAKRLGLCTWDGKGASDCLSYWLVEDQLPIDWFRALDAVRTGYAELPNKEVIPLEKFSSMGNGFTFELETLVFYALAKAICIVNEWPTEYLSVYGDDVICDARAYAELVRLFQVVGIATNREKSYYKGEFFESCGRHYFNECDVTPFYQKELLYGLPELVRLHNRVLRWCIRTDQSSNRYNGSLSYLRRKARLLLDKRSRLPRVPTGTEGDAGFWTSGLKVQWQDGRALLDILETESNLVDSVSDESLLAISLKRGNVNATPKLPHLDDVISWDGKVALRGRPSYRIRRRWVEYRGTPVSLGVLSPTRYLVVDDWLTIRALIPQLRGVADLG